MKATCRFLDGIFFDAALERELCRAVFTEGLFYRKNPFSGVRADTFLEWCLQGDFQGRLVMISDIVHPVEEGEGVVLSEQARAIVEAAQDPFEVLKNLYPSVNPSSWLGSLADIMAKRRQASATLLKHDRPDVRAATETHIAELGKREDEARRYERESDRQREQRFE